MVWTISLARTARKQLEKLDKQTARRIADFLSQRIAPLENPRVLGKALNGGFERLWCYRVGDYRIICDIEDDKLVILVVELGNRREIYR